MTKSSSTSLTGNIVSPVAPFTFHASLERFNISPQAYLKDHPGLTELVVSATLFDTPFPSSSPSPPLHSPNSPPPPPRTLLIQRAATDRYPLMWECPGGGVEHAGRTEEALVVVRADETILHAVARELAEETGLVMTRAEALIDDTCEFTGRGGAVRARKFTFVVDFDKRSSVSGRITGKGEEVVIAVALNSEEHTDAMWATEEEVLRGEDQQGRKIVFGFADQRERILEGFRLMREGI